MNPFIYILNDRRRQGQLWSEGQPAGPSPSRAQLQRVGMNTTGTRASDPVHETLPGDMEAPGTAVWALFGEKAVPALLWSAAPGERGASWLSRGAPERLPALSQKPSAFLVNSRVLG